MAEPDLLALAGAPTPAGPGRPTDADLTRGHRERLRERLFENPESLQDYELLEYLLAIAIPRRDTKRTAKLLLQRFGSIGQVFAAEPRFLKDVEGMGDVTAAAIKIAHATALFMLKSRAREAPILSSWQALADYLHADMAHDLVERFRVLHLNTRNMLVRDEVMSRGTIDEAAVHVREVVKRALDLQSAALILVHNHPSGDPSPSKADIAMTRAIIDAGRPLNIAVHDHIIVGLNGQVSFRSKGLI